jgi:hypothetical protein
MKTTQALDAVTVTPMESLGAIWARRAITIPGVFLLTALLVALAPFVLPVLALVDTARRADFRLVRFYLSIFVLIGLHGCTPLAS